MSGYSFLWPQGPFVSTGNDTLKYVLYKRKQKRQPLIKLWKLISLLIILCTQSIKIRKVWIISFKKKTRNMYIRKASIEKKLHIERLFLYKSILDRFQLHINQVVDWSLWKSNFHVLLKYDATQKQLWMGMH